MTNGPQMENDLVGPTGLKPAPYGLKGRRSATRAPGQGSYDLTLDIFHLLFKDDPRNRTK